MHMIRVRQVKVLYNETNNLKNKIAKKLKIKTSDIIDYKIIKESIDARKKDTIYLVYEVDVKLINESIINKLNDFDVFASPIEEYNFKPTGTKELNNRIVVVGSGPAGLFCSYMLALYGYKPLIIERGSDIDKRDKDVNIFFEKGILDEESNIQFGLGGAGAYSDGKLNTMVKDKFYRGKKAFEIFIECGAPEEILYKSKPHIGTDLLKPIIKNMRDKIISMGGRFLLDTKLSDIHIENNQIKEIVVNDKDIIKTDVLVLAIGHSARDTFKMLNKYLKMEAKAFAVGLRIQHPQKLIDDALYGKSIKELGPSSYKLTHTTKDNRGVYTFCMCPGGYVINASSEKGYLAINGMSNHNRDTINANSAVIVTVSPKDFGNNPMDGINYQKELEKKTYNLANGKIPLQLYNDFKKNIKSNSFGSIKPIIKGNYELSNINSILPDYLTNSLIEGIDAMNNKINGFSSNDAILAAIESRTSSPVRIIRDTQYEANIKGIYPAGEGAGYAGGITSSAIDGIKIAEAIMNKYK